MITLRCTRKLLDRLQVPADAGSTHPPDAALGDWYANLVRVGHDQLVVAMSERSFLVLVMPARDVRHALPREMTRALTMVLHELGVPQQAIEREVAAMHPMAYARTASKSVLASLNERVRMLELLWRDGLSAVDIMARMSGFLGPAALGGDDPARRTRRLLGLEPMPAPPARVARLHIALEDSSPSIWRRLLVPADISLPRLHRAFQLAMGWEDRHLHEFEIGDARYGTPDPDFPREGLRPERGVRLDAALAASGADRFRYWYDFGDDWSHEVRVEAVGPNEEGIRGPVCLQGANRCPPEDVGGMHGYMELLHALRDAAHPRHRELKEWMGGEDCDPGHFDLALANAWLRADTKFGGRP